MLAGAAVTLRVGGGRGLAGCDLDPASRVTGFRTELGVPPSAQQSRVCAAATTNGGPTPCCTLATGQGVCARGHGRWPVVSGRDTVRHMTPRARHWFCGASAALEVSPCKSGPRRRGPKTTSGKGGFAVGTRRPQDATRRSSARAGGRSGLSAAATPGRVQGPS
jgi:hypothetical protein